MDHESNHQNRAQQMAEFTRLSQGVFKLSAEKIAESLASPAVSPRGASSGLRLLTFYMNYAVKRLSPARRRTLEKAKELLIERVTRELSERERRQHRKAV